MTAAGTPRTPHSPRTCAIAFAVTALAGCVDELPQQTSRIDAPRVLAVIATPAEAAPRAAVHYDAIVAAPAGPVVAPAVAWAYCVAPRPPTEDNVVPAGCVDDPAALAALGDGPGVDATVPDDACRNHGPDVPPGGFRPRDPDRSGGYYQPVRAAFAGAPLAFGVQRLTCGLADAPPAIVREYRERYVANQHPAIASFAIAGGDPDALAPGAALTLAVTWTAGTAEPYVIYDREAAAIVDATETLRVGWFATGGALAVDATGATGELGSSVAWTAPTTPGPVHLWAVLHDDRGGVTTATLTATVR